MKRTVLAMVILLAGALLVPQTGHALPVMSGVANYAVAAHWTATVNYEVYAPGETANGLAGDAYYHYFYYVSNTSPISGDELSQFTVGNPMKLPIITAGWVDRTGGTIVPWSISTGGSSVKFTFDDQPGYTFIYPTNSTEWLYFTTPFAPTLVDGGLQDGGTNNHQLVPGPAPEPASAMLLGLGLMGFVGRKLRRKFMA